MSRHNKRHNSPAKITSFADIPAFLVDKVNEGRKKNKATCEVTTLPVKQDNDKTDASPSHDEKQAELEKVFGKLEDPVLLPAPKKDETRPPDTPKDKITNKSEGYYVSGYEYFNGIPLDPATHQPFVLGQSLIARAVMPAHRVQDFLKHNVLGHEAGWVGRAYPLSGKVGMFYVVLYTNYAAMMFFERKNEAAKQSSKLDLYDLFEDVLFPVMSKEEQAKTPMRTYINGKPVEIKDPGHSGEGPVG